MSGLNWSNPYAASLSTWGNNVALLDDAISQFTLAQESAEELSNDTLSMEYQIENAFRLTAVDNALMWRQNLVDDLTSAKAAVLRERENAQEQYCYYLSLYKQHEMWLMEHAALSSW